MHGKLEQIKRKLEKRVLTLGTWVQIPNPASAEILSSSESFDWVCVDMEHSSISLETCEDLIRAIEVAGSLPIVRISSNNEDNIKRAMDSGAKGIIIPMVNHLDSLKSAHDAVHYPPRGKRGVGLARAQNWGSNFEKYINEIEKNCLVIPQIEHIESVRNIDEIFGSKLADAYIIGPYDLSASLGKPGNFNDEEFKSALHKVKKSADKFGIPHGFHLVDPDQNKLKKLIKDNYSFIAYSTDMILLREGGKVNVD